MTDGDSVRQVQYLRDHAITLLQEAAQCSDSERRDGLLREAVARLDEARLLLDRLDSSPERLGVNHSTKRIH